MSAARRWTVNGRIAGALPVSDETPLFRGSITNTARMVITQSRHRYRYNVSMKRRSSRENTPSVPASLGAHGQVATQPIPRPLRLENAAV